MRSKGFSVSNIDAVVIAEEPKIIPFKIKMQETIEQGLGLDKGTVNIKGKTNEGLGEIGNKEAIAAYAVVLIKRGA